MQRLFHIANTVINTEVETTPNDHFLQELEKVFNQFVDEIARKCKEKMGDDFDTLTKVIDWDLLHGFTALDELIFHLNFIIFYFRTIILAGLQKERFCDRFSFYIFLYKLSNLCTILVTPTITFLLRPKTQLKELQI